MYAYECWHKDYPEHKSIKHGLTAGRARVSYFYELRDAWCEVDYKDIRSRKVGMPRTSAGFLRNATYRGVPFARVGQKVKVGAEFGIIVGHNSSANFDVFFPDGEYKNLTLNCHPASRMMICIDYIDDMEDLWHCPESINCGPCQFGDKKHTSTTCHHQCQEHHYTTELQSCG